MKQIERKTYKEPTAQTVIFNNDSLLAGTNITSGGDNTDGPKEAESKLLLWDDDSDDNWE